MIYNQWFSTLFENYYALLYRIGRLFLGASSTYETIIEEEIQETFIKAWQNERKLRAHPNPAGWLVLTFRRRLMARCRKLGREHSHFAFSMDDESNFDTSDTACLSTEHFTEHQSQRELIYRLLGERDAELFFRYCVYKEGAKILAEEYHLSESGIKTRISRIKKKLLANKELFLFVVALLMFDLKR